MAAYTYWSHLDHAPFRLLAYMALVSLDHPKDGQPARRYFGGRDALCQALGHPVPPSDSTARTVRKAISALMRAGAIETVVKAAPGRYAEYALQLDGGTSGSRVRSVNGGTSGSATEELQVPYGGTSGSAMEELQVPPEEPLRNQSGIREDEGVTSQGDLTTRAHASGQPNEVPPHVPKNAIAAASPRAPGCPACGTYLDGAYCFTCRKESA